MEGQRASNRLIYLRAVESGLGTILEQTDRDALGFTDYVIPEIESSSDRDPAAVDLSNSSRASGGPGAGEAWTTF